RVAVPRRGARALGIDHQPAVAVDPPAGKALESRAHVVGKALRAAHVEAQLDRARELVDVLSARTRGTNEVLLELALADADRTGDTDHRESITPRRRSAGARAEAAERVSAVRFRDRRVCRGAWREHRAIRRPRSRSR